MCNSWMLKEIVPLHQKVIIQPEFKYLLLDCKQFWPSVPVHYIKQMKQNFFSFLFFPLPWEKMQREEPKCRCNSISTAAGDRHVVTTVHIKMTSGFSTHSINALRSLPSQHLQDSHCPSSFYLHHFHQLLKRVAQADMWPSSLHRWAPELHNVIFGQSRDKRVEQFLSHTRFWEGLERHLHFCLSTNEELLKLERHLFTKPKFW